MGSILEYIKCRLEKNVYAAFFWMCCPHCCLVAKTCLTLCDPMDCSMPGLPVPHHLPECAQVHVHRIIDALQPSHHLSPSSPSAFNLSPYQSLFQRSAFHIKWPKYWGFSFSISHSSESISIQSWFPLGLTGLISLMSKETSKIFSSTTIRQHQFFSAFTLLSSSHISTWQPERPWLWLCGPLLTKWYLCFLIYCLGLSLHSFQEVVVF